MTDRDYYTTEEMHNALNEDGHDISLERVEESFHDLEAAGYVKHMGTTDDGEDMWDIVSPTKAMAFLARELSKQKLSGLKGRFVGSGGDPSE